MPCRPRPIFSFKNASCCGNLLTTVIIEVKCALPTCILNKHSLSPSTSKKGLKLISMFEGE